MRIPRYSASKSTGNPASLVELLAARFSQLTPRDADFAVTTILESRNKAMVRGHRIEVRGSVVFLSCTVYHGWAATRAVANPWKFR